MFDELIEFCEKVSELKFDAVAEGALALVVAAAIVRYALIPILFGH
jgi:hypothetical protein